MSAFGENLRREREMRGVSLEEISSATKISLRFLSAIEREDFSKLPGGIFSRSFIRAYARYLGLDEERVVTEYQLAARPQVEFDLHRMAGSSSAGRPVARTSLIAVLIAVVLLAASYGLFRYSQRAAEAPVPPPPAPVVTAKPTAPPPASTTCVDTTAVPAPAVGEATPGAAPSSKVNCVPPSPAAAGEATPGAASGTAAAPGSTANPPGGAVAGAGPGTQSSQPTGNPMAMNPAANTDLVLQVAATERAWVAVEADGKTVLQRVLNPNEVETVKAHKSFDVTTGNAQSVILTLNGETLKPLGRHGEVKSLHLTREDLKNSAP